MTPFQAYLRDPRPAPDEVRAVVERMLTGPMDAKDQWLARQIKLALHRERVAA